MNDFFAKFHSSFFSALWLHYVLLHYILKMKLNAGYYEKFCIESAGFVESSRGRGFRSAQHVLVAFYWNIP